VEENYFRNPFSTKISSKMGFGDYPAEYNPKVHGVFDPARFYGKGEWLTTAEFEF
jgi:hypothetical protein